MRASFCSQDWRPFPLTCPPARLRLLSLLCGRRWHRTGGLEPRGFFHAPSAEKGAFHRRSLTVGCSLVGSLQSIGCRALPLGFVFVSSWRWQKHRAALQPRRLGSCSACGSLWLDPGLPEASLSSLLVSMRNAPIRAPDGTQTNLGCQSRPAHFQGLGLTSVLFPLVAIEP